MSRNRLGIILILALFVMSFISCDDTVTYSEMKEKEREAVADYIKSKGIVVNEPSVVAVETETKKVIAVGKEANEMC